MKTFAAVAFVLVSGLLLAAGLTAGVAWVLSWGWGVAIVPLGVPAITWFQAWCLMLVVGILTSGFRASVRTSK